MVASQLEEVSSSSKGKVYTQVDLRQWGKSNPSISGFGTEKLKYLNTEKAVELTKLSGLQLPAAGKLNGLSERKIYTQEDLRQGGNALLAGDGHFGAHTRGRKVRCTGGAGAASPELIESAVHTGALSDMRAERDLKEIKVFNAAYRHGDATYRVRFVAKYFEEGKTTATKDKALHGFRLQEIILEKESARQNASPAGRETPSEPLARDTTENTLNIGQLLGIVNGGKHYSLEVSDEAVDTAIAREEAEVEKHPNKHGKSWMSITTPLRLWTGTNPTESISPSKQT